MPLPSTSTVPSPVGALFTVAAAGVAVATAEGRVVDPEDEEYEPPPPHAASAIAPSAVTATRWGTRIGGSPVRSDVSTQEYALVRDRVLVSAVSRVTADPQPRCVANLRRLRAAPVSPRAARFRRCCSARRVRAVAPRSRLRRRADAEAWRESACPACLALGAVGDRLLEVSVRVSAGAPACAPSGRLGG